MTLQRLDCVTAEFSRLDQAAAIDRIRALADSGFTETQIVTFTGWRIGDIRRALGDRL